MQISGRLASGMNTISKSMWNSFLKKEAFWCTMNVWKVMQNGIPRDSTQLWDVYPHFIEIVCPEGILCNSTEYTAKDKAKSLTASFTI